MTLSSSAASDTVRAIGPSWFIVSQPCTAWGQEGTRPNWGFRPATPQRAAGILIEPPPSLPTASGDSPAASPAAAPPLEPPTVFFLSQGFQVGPNTELSVTATSPNSGTLVLPSITPPASLIRSTRTASASGT